MEFDCLTLYVAYPGQVYAKRLGRSVPLLAEFLPEDFVVISNVIHSVGAVS